METEKSLLDHAWGVIGALAVALWGMLTWRIGRGEKDTGELLKAINQHIKDDAASFQRLEDKITSYYTEILTYLRDSKHG